MTDNRVRRWALRFMLGLLGLCLMAVLGLWLFLRGSLATLDGDVAGQGLHAEVIVNRDALGVPTVAGQDRDDLAYATGYLHAQDRFFQMDLMRRVAAGELAELIGPAALDIDRSHRFHRFRARAEAALAALSAQDRQLLDRYTAGVNDGLAALRSRPFEYGLLRLQPRAWQPADTPLVVWAMYFELQGNLERRELARGWLKAHSTPEQLAFLLPESTLHDAPLDVLTLNLPLAPASAPDWFARPSKPSAASQPFRSSVGSNNWAVAGSRSEHGVAIVANDMHLGIRLPHIWYRAVLQYPDGQGGQRQVAGVTLPGAPLVVAGSNGHVAWGFTNSYGDYLDLVELQRDPANPLRFKLPGGWETVRPRVESLLVKGQASETLTVLESSLGPIRELGGRYYAVHWVAHEPGAVNLALRGMEAATDLAQAQAVANRAGMPAQNMTAGDSAGHIGWTIAGPLPARDAEFAASFPYPAEASQLGWQGLRAPADYPRVNDPAAGQLWTANNRQLAGADYRKIGDGGADIGARAQQVRDDLSALGKTTEQGVYGVGLDDRALFLEPWRERALKVLTDSAVATRPQRAEFRRLLIEGWSGRASVDSVGYRLTRGFMHALYDELFAAADEQMAAEFEGADYALANPRWSAVAARLVDERPKGWLSEGRSWQALQLAAIDRVIGELTQGGRQLAEARWGARNTAAISHPFARFMPALKSWLSAPADELPGDEDMPRVAAPNFGQSERMVVAPGKEALGIFNMPGGQSGHPLSAYFLAGHEAWVRGDPTPFLPGPAEHTLRIVPAR
ncbi:penicillin acylase family protein [Chitinimonas sp.]|uniref:penicillin acylase family protein n=1 Tax=Chitinimonas sp. TaxID=1934313 RepID=UPI002F93474D